MSRVLDLADAAVAPVSVVGSKARNLGRMIRDGLPVPKGFVISVDTYHEFMTQNHIPDVIAHHFDALQPTAERAQLLEALSLIQKSFIDSAMPQELASEISGAYRNMEETRVAVRSSATAEDLPGASFAGQYDTYLNQHGVECVLDCVKRCWASFFAERAFVSRARYGLGQAEAGVAVIVQQMVLANASGVLFTANPLNGRRDQMVLNSTFGLGEPLVGGRVNPDQWILDSASGHVISKSISIKPLMDVARESGIECIEVPSAQQRAPSLEDTDISSVIDLGRKAAALFGTPQDIEWAKHDAHLYVIQSRPITSLFPIISRDGTPNTQLRVYVCHTLIQGISEPLTKLGLCVLEEVQRVNKAINGAQIAPHRGNILMKHAACRLFIDVTETLKHKALGPKLLFVLGRVEPVTSCILVALKRREPELSYASQPLPSSGMSFGQVLSVMWQMLCAVLRPDHVRERACSEIERNLDQIEHTLRSLESADEALSVALSGIARLRDLLLPLYAPLGAGLMGQEITERMLKKWGYGDEWLGQICRSLPNNPTTQMNLQLWKIATLLKRQGERPSAGHPEVSRFLSRFGHRALKEIDVGMPRWREEPGYVLKTLETYMKADSDALARFEHGSTHAQQAANELLLSVSQQHGRFAAFLLRHAIRLMRQLSGLRESPKFYSVRLFGIVREALLRCGDSLVSEHRLDRREDVAWLTLHEIRTRPDGRLDFRALVAARKSQYEAEMLRTRVPRVVTSTGETFYEPPAETVSSKYATLSGVPASSGTYEGTARVLHNPHDSELLPGEILVAPGTDPAWTPLFLTAGAVVTETGGSMSHGAIVAREHGLPAVVGVQHATRLIRTGARLRVDGLHGTLALLDAPNGKEESNG